MKPICIKFVNMLTVPYPKQDLNLGPKQPYCLLKFGISVSKITRPPQPVDVMSNN